MRPAALALLCIAACGTPQVTDTPFKTHALHKGNRQPPDKVAVLLVLTPPDHDGTSAVRKIRDPRTGVEYEPKLEWSLIEMLPGRYLVHAGFWTQRTSLTTGRDGKQALKLDDLLALKLVPMHIDVAAGKTYFIDPELRRKDGLTATQLKQYHTLQYGSEVTRTREPRSTHGVAEEHVWRPRLGTLSPEQAARYGR